MSFHKWVENTERRNEELFLLLLLEDLCDSVELNRSIGNEDTIPVMI